MNPLRVRIVLCHHVGEDSAFTRRIGVTAPPAFEGEAQLDNLLSYAE